MPPLLKPKNPNFCSGPTAKRPGWHVNVLQNALMGRSHRSHDGIERIQEILALTRQILEIPDDYQLALVGGSATGAVEMALWNFMGQRPVDSLAWDIFGHRWQYQLQHVLRLTELRCLNAAAGYLPDLAQIDDDHDIVFTWNGSTSGVCVPHDDWIDSSRRGLTLCDATSAVFTMALPWSKLDVTAFSWQKGLGSEAAHGMLVLSPRAVERLESYQPPWPVPGLYRLRERGQFHHKLFEGLTTNTPSMLCIEDYRDALIWAKKVGGLPQLVQRSLTNKGIIEEWLINHSDPWLQFLAQSYETRSSSTICLKLSNKDFDIQQQWTVIKTIGSTLREHRVAYDIINHAAATPAFRIWGGSTVESYDIKQCLLWLDWAYKEIL